MTIKPLLKLLPLLLTFTLLLSLTACGGGGSGATTPTPQPQAQPQKVTATFALQGSASTLVGAVDLDLLLPVGFVLATDSFNQPAASAMTFLVDGATAAVNYTPETIAANGAIQAGIIKSDGFTGNTNLMQISCIYAAGTTLPTADDFMVTVNASDLSGVPLTGISGNVSLRSQSAL